MNKTIFFRIRGVLKNIETEAVFTKKEINNDRNVNFLQNTRYTEKICRLKLCLPRQKQIMILIFVKIKGVSKSIVKKLYSPKPFSSKYENLKK